MAVCVDEVIKMCKLEAAKLMETMGQFREIVQSMEMLNNDICENEESSSGDAKNEDIPLKELQEIELLEQVLKKASKVRSCSAVPRNLCAEGKKPSNSSYTNNSKAPIKNTVEAVEKINPQKSSFSMGVHGRRPQRIIHEHVPTQCVLVKRRSQVQPTMTGKEQVTNPSQKKSCQPCIHSRDTNSRTMIVDAPSLEVKMTSQMSLTKKQWVPSPFLPAWKAQRAKRNSLWKKALSRHSKPVPERACFKDRLTSNFQLKCPFGLTDARGTELDALVQLGLDLSHCYNAELQGQQSLLAETSVERQYESLLMLEGLETMMTKVVKNADSLKKVWERKVGGPVHLFRENIEWHDPMQNCLPLMLFYGTESELEELNTLRLRIDQLQLEIRLHQAISDTLTHHLNPQQSTTLCPSATVLRGLYSLLGEGGRQFPALVLDSEANQT